MMMAAPVAVAAVVEEKTEFDVVLDSFPADKKIAVLKVRGEAAARCGACALLCVAPRVPLRVALACVGAGTALSAAWRRARSPPHAAALRRAAAHL
jgi:hypothetical protein